MLLSLRDVCKNFGALRVIDHLDLEVAAGETLGILGPNGAGKTTLFNIIGGDIRADTGRVEFGGEDITRLGPHRRCRLGIGRSYQVPRPFGTMTVFENLVVAGSFGGARAEAETYEQAVQILSDTGLLAKANQLAGALTLLDRKRLELARALATRPRLLLLDEIAGGLTEPEAGQLVDEIRRIQARGISIVWIEHVVRLLLSVADRLLVIHFGQELAQGKPDAVMHEPAVQRVYMGIEA